MDYVRKTKRLYDSVNDFKQWFNTINAELKHVKMIEYRVN